MLKIDFLLVYMHICKELHNATILLFYSMCGEESSPNLPPKKLNRNTLSRSELKNMSGVYGYMIKQIYFFQPSMHKEKVAVEE